MVKDKALVGKCNKCDNVIKLTLDNAEITKKEAIEMVKPNLHKISECPGHHCEVNGMEGYWDVDSWELEDVEVPSDEEFLADLRAKHKEVIDTEEINKRKIVVAFSHGVPITRDEHLWNFTQDPSGKRWYYTTP
jgi:hypothetical protein